MSNPTLPIRLALVLMLGAATSAAALGVVFLLALEKLIGLPNQDSGRELSRHPLRHEVVAGVLQRLAAS